MLEAIGAAVGKQIIDSFFGRALDAFKAYQEGKISLEQLKTQLLQHLLDSFAEVEKAHADALAKTFDSFQQTLRVSPELVRMVKVVVYSQTFVLFWSQWVVPMAHWLGYGGAWRAGTTAEWAYLLIGGLCGLAPMVLRSGPGAGDLAGNLKRLVGK